MGGIQKVLMFKHTPHRPNYNEYILLILFDENSCLKQQEESENKAKVCMTLGRKTTYCHEIWTHMKLAR